MHGTHCKIVELQHDCMLDLNFTGKEYKQLLQVDIIISKNQALQI